MSTISEVHAFLVFLREVFVEKEHCFPRTNSRAAAKVEHSSHVALPVHHMSRMAPSSELASMVASSG